MDADALWLLEPDTLENPYPLYHRLRAEDPVHWDDRCGWLILRHRDVAAVLRDPRFSAHMVSNFADRIPPLLRFHTGLLEKTMSRWMIFIDPPDHGRLRSLISKAFTPSLLQRAEGDIQRLVDGLIDAAQSRNPPGCLDVIADVALPLPAMAVLQMLTGATENIQGFLSWSHDLMVFMGKGQLTETDVRNAGRSMAAMLAEFRSLLARRREKPERDLMSALLSVREQGTGFTEQEILEMCTLLFAAGHENTTNLIGNGVLALLQHPSLLQRLTTDAEGIASFVDEVLRFDSPTQAIPRLVLEDLELGGKTIRSGQYVNLMLGAVGRDPEVFENPDVLDIDRKNIRHLTFGHGIHFCPGALLARQEARLAFATLLRRFPTMSLADTVLERYPSIASRGVKSLPILVS